MARREPSSRPTKRQRQGRRRRRVQRRAPGARLRDPLGAADRARGGADAALPRPRSTEARGGASSRSRSRALITIEPAKRAYDDATASAWSSSSASPSAGRRRPRSFRWAQADALVPAFDGRDRVRARACPAPTTSSSPPPSTSTGSPDGEAPLRFHFNGTVFYEADDGRMQIVQVPWDRSAALRDAGRGLAGDDRRRTTRTAAGCRCTPRRSSGCERLKAERGLPTFDAAVDELLADEGGGGRRCTSSSSGSSRSLLYEGYALYPYTPGATKNATPTPFGIVYPPAYASAQPATFDHLRLECVLDGGPATPSSRRDGPLPAGVGRAPRGGRARGCDLGAGARWSSWTTPASASRSSSTGDRTVRGRRGCAPSRSASAACGACAPASTTRTELEAELRRRAARRCVASLLSTHVVLEAGAAAASPRRSSATARPARPCEAAENVNTFPVLAAPDDDAVLGARDRAPRPPAARARRASATSSTTPRSRRRCCCTCRRSQRRRARGDRRRRTRRCGR